MSEISKSQLKADNATSFPDNNSGYITPLALRNFNINMIDSTVSQAGYTADSSSWNVSIGALNTYTSSFAPSLTQLNAFTASQLVINTGVNGFTQSANYSIGAFYIVFQHCLSVCSDSTSTIKEGLCSGYLQYC